MFLKAFSNRNLALWFFTLSSLLPLTTSGCKSGYIAHQPDTLIIGMERSPTNLDPRIGIDLPSENFHQLLFNGLVRRGDHDRMVPDLALAIEQVSPVFYRFRLRRDVVFHNGKPLEASDVAYTFNSILDGTVITTKKALFENVESITAPNRDVVEIRLKAPFNRLLTNLNIGIVPEGSTAEFASHPIGTGPYKLTKFEPDAGAQLEAFPRYFEGQAKMRTLRVRVIPDATTRALELRKGSVDLVMLDLTQDIFDVLKRDPNLKVASIPGNRYTYLGLNLKDPILRNRDVRQAMAYAIDRGEIIGNLFHGSAQAATGLLPPWNWAYEPEVLSISYDMHRAEALLDRAGYPDPDGSGPEMRFWLEFKSTTNEFRRVVATVIQRDLARVGIGIKLRTYEWGTFFSDVNHGNFQLFLLQWVGESDPDIFRSVFETHGSRNRGKYSDPQVDSWIAEAGRAETEADQKRLYSLIQKKVAEDCPYVSLWYETNLAVMRNELMGAHLSANANFRFLKDVYWPELATKTQSH
jgi:peptide/nickel transport system substrate-binding protein